MRCLRSSMLTVLTVLATLLLFIGFGITVSPPAEAAVIRPFGTRFTLNTTGAIVMTGNAMLTCPPTATSCLAARTGTAPTLAANNDNNYSMIFIDIDGDAATFNSSRNTVTIPATSTVAWAGLYWGADTTAGTGGSAAPNAAARGQVLLRTPASGSYLPITASQVDTSAVTGGVRYQGFADVTTLVTAARSGEYTVANVQAGRGNDRYGGWALVIAYQDPSEPLRNLTVFDGYAVVQQTPVADQNVAIPVSGFLTPPTGPVRSRVGVVAYEGDLGLLGDSLRLNATPLTNSLNPATNFFNSSLTGFNTTITTGDPFQTNMLGFDVDTINANGVLANSATSATINLNTNNDTYFPGVVSFSTELFAPRLDVSKSGLDLNGGSLDVGDEVLYTVQLVNDGEDGASGVVVSDLIPEGTSYVAGTLRIGGQPVTDTPGDDAGELAAGPPRVVARLGTGASASAGGSMPIGATGSMSFVVTVDDVPGNDVLTNVATVSYRGATSGLPLEGVSNAVVLTPRSRSDLSLLKFGPAAPVTVPGTVDFQLVVVNRGPAAEPLAVVTDTLPTGLTVSAVTASQGSCSVGVAGGTVDCNLGSLGIGATAIIDVSAVVTSGSGTVTNVASVVGSNLDLLPGNNTARATVALNQPPVAVDQAVSTPAATPVAVAVLSGATDPDGDPISTVAAGPAVDGSVVVNVDGTVTYTPDPSFKGLDSFSFTIADGQGGYGAATVTVTVANAIPVATDDAAATLPNTPITIDVVANDTDANSDPLTIVAVTQPVGGAATGVVTDTGSGTITFAPAASFRGSATFTYTISDGSDIATATVTVTVPNAAPVAVDDAATTPSGVAVDVAVLVNDLDDNDESLTVVAVTQPPGGAATGVVTNNGDGTVEFAPAASFKGIATFTYTISDGSLTATASVSVTVLNAAPDAMDDSASTGPATPVDIAVLANDSDPNTDPLTIIDVTSPANGTAVVGPAGIVTYTSNPGFKGDDTFTYTVSDGTDAATATVTVTVPNSPPVAAADRRSTETNTSVTIPVLANDFDPNGDLLSIIGVTQPANGSAVVDAAGTVTYTPGPGFKGDDTFTYTVSDGDDTATATVTIRVLNAAPVAVDDAITTLAATPVGIPVLTNDFDPNGDPLSIVAVTQPTNGIAAVNADGTITYTPNAGFAGTDIFSYTVSDGVDTVSATVVVTVGPTATPALAPTPTPPPGATPIPVGAAPPHRHRHRPRRSWRSPAPT